MRGALLSFLLAGALVMPKSCPADGFTIEAGAAFGSNFPTGSGHDPVFGSLAFTGQAGYEGPDWSVGVRAMNGISNVTATHIVAGPYDLSGSLRRRLIQLGIFGRFFFLNPKTRRKRVYLELGFQGLESDYVDAQAVYDLPQSPDYTRLFLRGNGFSLGVGYRPENGPWFYQVDYQLKRYEQLLVEGNVNHLHQTVGEASLNGNYFVHSLVILVGLEVFGRH